MIAICGSVSLGLIRGSTYLLLKVELIHAL